MNAPAISLKLALKIIDGRAPDEIIHRDGDPMFERWWLLRTPSGQEGGNVYLHRWLRSDREAPHCHPWDSKTTVLSGWLDEESWLSPMWFGSAPGQRIIRCGESAFRLATEIHAIVACHPGTITLFETGVKTREWGFYPEGKFVPWREYHGLPADWNQPAGAEQVAS